MKKSLFALNIFFICFVFLQNAYVQELDAFWTLVFAGDNITTPVFSGGNIYTAGADKALNCITNQGSFLWRRNTSYYPTSLISTSSAGVVYLITKGGNIEAYSSQGVPIWTYKCQDVPLFPLYIASDGYLIITCQNKIIALTRQGKLKWELSLPSTPIKEPFEVAGNNLIVLLQDESFLRISMFGKLVEILSLKKSIETISFAPEGYIISCNDKSISYYKIGEPSMLVWQKNEEYLVRSITYKDSSFLCIYSNGEAVLRNLGDGSPIWACKLDVASISSEIKCTYSSGEFKIRDRGFGAIVLQNGKIKWQKVLLEKDFLPIITDNGLLIGIRKEILNAYRMETKLLRKNEKRVDPSKKSSSKEIDDIGANLILSRATVLYLLGFSTFDFFKDVENDIKNGSVGDRENYYAIMLSGIIQNDARNAYFSHEFSSFERGRAAMLLGEMGLYQYRDVLLSQINVSIDSELSVGVLKGLASLAYDPDGRTIEGVMFILNKTSANDVDVLKAVVDTFFALAKFGDKVTAKKAIESVFSIMNGAYPAVIKEYVKKKLKTLV